MKARGEAHHVISMRHCHAKEKEFGAAAWVNPDDAPDLTEKFFDRAEIRQGEQGRPSRPASAAQPQQAVKLRLDSDVLAAYRKTGVGWQTRINADLRKARKLKAG